MVCFLSCFGIGKKHKRRHKPARKTQRPCTVEGKYQPLGSGKPAEPDRITGFIRNARRGSLADKIKKKVSFNLDVKIYEHLQQEEIDSDFSDDGQENSESEYPSDYRYCSCRDSFDDDDMILDESDLEEDMDEDDDSDNGFESNNGCILIHGDERKSRVLFSDLGYITDDYVNCVLKPVENLTQWKAMKATEGTRFLRKNQKENTKGGEQEDEKPSINYKKIKKKCGPIRVDASLSNWLISSEKTAGVTVNA